MKLLALPLLLLLLFQPISSDAAVISGHELPDTITRFDTNFRLQGCGLRELLFSDIYLLGMYLVDTPLETGHIRQRGTAKVFLLKVLYKGDLPDDIPSVWRDPLSRQVSDEYLEILQELYDRVNPGDWVEFGVHPDGGEVLKINDRIEVRESGEELLPALVELWLGDPPVSGNLKRLLLSGNCS